MSIIDDVKPDWTENDIPYCDQDRCPSYDGKRCRVSGLRPDTICEPAIIHFMKRTYTKE